MELHVCITIDDDAVNKVANMVTETVKRVAQIQQPSGTKQPAIETQSVPPQGQPAGTVSGAVPATAYSAQIAQATQLPVQAMTGQPVSAPQAPQPVAAVPQSAVTPQPVRQPGVPTAVHNYTLEELARAATPLMDQGEQVMAHLRALLNSYGVELLNDLPPEHYGSFATALRGMGAQI